VREGRAFTDRDAAGAPEVVILNRALARRLYGDGGAVGRRLKLVSPDQGDGWRTVVGVVDDVRYSGLDDPGEAAVYTPFAQTPFLWTYVMVRTQGPPMALAGAIRAAVTSVDPSLEAAAVKPMAEVMAETVAQPRFNVMLLSALAGLALVLAAVGIYGVISYSVAQRTREIGIRMALGAERRDILRMVLRHGSLMAAAGIGLGLAVALGLARLITSLLFQVSATDPPTFSVVPVVLIAVALLACSIPARTAWGLPRSVSFVRTRTSAPALRARSSVVSEQLSATTSTRTSSFG